MVCSPNGDDAEYKTPEENTVKVSHTDGIGPVACDLESSISSSPCIQGARRVQSILRVQSGRKLCPSEVNTRRRKAYSEKLLVKRAIISGDLKLISVAIKTDAGRKAMPELANALLGTEAHFEQLKNNTIELMRKCGRAHKKEVSHMLVSGLPAGFCRDELDMKKTEIDSARREPTDDCGARDRLGRSTTGNGLSKQNYSHGVRRCKVSETEDFLLHSFFLNSTHVASGADRLTRILGKKKVNWAKTLDGAYPGMLRALARDYPFCVPAEDLSSSPEDLTNFEANMLAAIAQGEQPGFDAKEEIQKREDQFMTRYTRKNLVQAGDLPKESKSEKKARTDAQQLRTDMRSGKSGIAFDGLAYEVRGVGLPGLEAYLKRRGLKYTTFSMPHPCTICDNGDSWMMQVAELKRQKASAGLNADEVWSIAQAQKLTDLMKKEASYTLHKEQLATGRAAVKKLEEDLKPGEAIVVRDYVNHHDHSGKHVKCLHWVLMWRNEGSTRLEHLKLRHYCSEKNSMMTDAYYTADVMDFHFKPKGPKNPGLFDQFEKVYFVGDHGPHFACADTVYNESRSFDVYGKHVVLMFFTSYHAFGRADGAGAEDSTSARQDGKDGIQRLGAASYTAMTNESNDQRSWGYHMAQVNRNVDFFPKGVQAKNKHVRKWMEIKFEFPGSCKDTVGICLYRLVTGVGEWRWCDMLQGSREPGAELCEGCSTKEQSLQYHAMEECPDPQNVHDIPTYVPIEFDESRIDQSKQKKRPRNRGEKQTQMVGCALGCKSAAGRPRRFRSKMNANMHYKLEHKLTGAEYDKLAYPDEVRGPVQIEKAQEGKDDVRSRKKKKKTILSSESEQSGNDSGSNDNENSEDDPDGKSFVVEAVITHRKVGGSYEYLVQWKGYSEQTWEPKSSFVGNGKMLNLYIKEQKGKSKSHK